MNEETPKNGFDETPVDDHKFSVPAGKEHSTTYQLKKINQLHREIIRLIVLGYKDKEIGTMLDCSPVTVRYVKESEVVQTHLNKLHFDRDEDATDLSKTIKRFAPLALEVATSIMNDDSANNAVRANIAQDILDRAGYKPVDVRANVGSGKVDANQIAEIKARAKRAGVMFTEDTEEADYEDVTEKDD